MSTSTEAKKAIIKEAFVRMPVEEARELLDTIYGELDDKEMKLQIFGW